MQSDQHLQTRNEAKVSKEVSSSFEGMYALRPYDQETDKAFIMATFLRGLYYGESWFSQIPKDIFMHNYKRVLESLIDDRKRSTVVIACLKDEPNVIIGYSILSLNCQVIHWVHVKRAWRQKGIAKSLLPQEPTAVTHLTKTGKELLPKFKNTVFDPFSL